MATNFRGYLDTLKKNEELTVISKATDLRDVAAVPQSDKALLFTNVRGYSMPVASGLLQSRNRLALGMSAAYEKIETKLRTAMDHPIKPKRVAKTPVKEVIFTKNKVDLYQLPVPIFSVMDGGPMITAGVVIAEDPEFGMNAGMYRLMLNEKNITGIDIVTPNNLRKFAERAFQQKKPLPISVYEEQFLDWLYPIDRAFFPGKRVLDAGCGTGRHAYLASRFGAREVVAARPERRRRGGTREPRPPGERARRAGRPPAAPVPHRCAGWRLRPRLLDRRPPSPSRPVRRIPGAAAVPPPRRRHRRVAVRVREQRVRPSRRRAAAEGDDEDVPAVPPRGRVAARGRLRRRRQGRLPTAEWHAVGRRCH